VSAALTEKDVDKTLEIMDSVMGKFNQYRGDDQDENKYQGITGSISRADKNDTPDLWDSMLSMLDDKRGELT